MSNWSHRFISLKGTIMINMILHRNKTGDVEDGVLEGTPNEVARKPLLGKQMSFGSELWPQGLETGGNPQPRCGKCQYLWIFMLLSLATCWPQAIHQKHLQAFWRVLFSHTWGGGEGVWSLPFPFVRNPHSHLGSSAISSPTCWSPSRQYGSEGFLQARTMPLWPVFCRRQWLSTRLSSSSPVHTSTASQGWLVQAGKKGKHSHIMNVEIKECPAQSQGLYLPVDHKPVLSPLPPEQFLPIPHESVCPGRLSAMEHLHAELFCQLWIHGCALSHRSWRKRSAWGGGTHTNVKERR